MNFTSEIEQYKHRYGLTSLQPDAFLFDMDGTLYDSMGNHAGAWHAMAQEAGFKSTPDEFYLYEGATGAATVNKLFQRAYGRDATAEEAEVLYRRKAEIFRNMGEPRIMPGARKLVDYVRSLPWHPAVVLVTGSGQLSLLDRLNMNFDGAFPENMRVTARDVTNGKPSPEPYLKGMSLACSEPWRCVAIENAPLGIMSAHRAGAFTVAVTTGPIPAEDMLRAGADVLFHSMEQCADLFPELIHQMTISIND